MSRSLKFAAAPTLIVLFLALYPQISLWLTKGSAWHGSYVVSNYDETAYSAYINALVNGGSRRSDPFIGADSEYESLYSIQFVPAYLIAVPARLLGISTATAFILLSGITAIFSSLAIFWLINSVTENRMLALTGTLVVLCFGTAAAFQGELSGWIRGSVMIDFLPFLRRYQPGLAFPLFWVFCGLVWQSFSDTRSKRSIVFAVASGVAIALLIFSYFYLWTAAGAWLACFTVITLIARSEDRLAILLRAFVIAVFALAALVPYWLLLSHRSPDLDEVQLLQSTHLPDLFSPSLLLGVLVLLAIVICAYRRIAGWTRPAVLLAASFSLTPFVLFNQQIVTGRSLQPLHYEIFIANYLVLAAFVLFAGSFLQKFATAKTLGYVAAAAVIWGAVEAAGSSGRNSLAAEIRDESVPAFRLIEQDRSNIPDNGRPVVLATNFITSDLIPTYSTARSLWNPHTSSAGGVSIAENKRLFYLYLYFSGYTDRDVSEALSQDSFEVVAALFGSERALAATTGKNKSIEPAEIKQAAAKYAEFIRDLDPGSVRRPQLNYLIVPAKAEPNYANIDRWYTRDPGQVTGLFKVYRLTSKNTDQ